MSAQAPFIEEESNFCVFGTVALCSSADNLTKVKCVKLDPNKVGLEVLEEKTNKTSKFLVLARDAPEVWLLETHQPPGPTTQADKLSSESVTVSSNRRLQVDNRLERTSDRMIEPRPREEAAASRNGLKHEEAFLSFFLLCFRVFGLLLTLLPP